MKIDFLYNNINKTKIIFYDKKIIKKIPGNLNSIFTKNYGVKHNSLILTENDIFIGIDGKRKSIDFFKNCIDKKAGIFIFEDKYFDTIKKLLIKIKPEEKIIVFFVKNTIKETGNLAKKYLLLFNGKKIFLTGSVGKTGTKEILWHFLNLKYTVFKNEKNFNNHIGLPESILNIKKDYDFFIFEAGMNHKGEIDYLSKTVKPDIGILTNIFPVHIGNFKNLKEIAKAKLEFLNNIKNNSIIFTNKDINFLEFIKKEVKKYKLDLFVFDKINFILEVIFKNNKYISFLKYNKKKIKTNIYNHSFLNNLNLAFNIGLFYNIDENTMFKSIKKFKLIDSRFETKGKRHNIIDDAYNSNPESLKQAINSFIKLKSNRNKILILGDMLELGKYSKKYHAEIANFLNNSNNDIISKIILIGKDMRICYNKLRFNNKIYYDSTDNFINNFFNIITKTEFNKYDFFVKASNGMKFNKIITYLEKI